MVYFNMINESISFEQDLLNKLVPLSEAEIFEFMQNLRGGTYFNMGMYSYIPVSRAYKKTFRIYKVLNLTAIVSGVSYENIGTTKDFRDRTGKAASSAWYDHMYGFENKVGVKKSDPNSKYVLWDVKAGSDTWVCYYLVDIDSGVVKPLTKDDVLNSDYLTASEKAKMQPKKVEGFDKTTGELIENQTTWRTAAFEHIFWLSQAGKNTKEYGIKFMENTKIDKNENLTEGHDVIPEMAYVIKTDDGPNYKDVYLAWSNDADCYTTVDHIDEIGDGDYKVDVESLAQNAKNANSMTFGGWEAPMHIVKVSNFRNAYTKGADPEEEIVRTIDFNEPVKESLTEGEDFDIFRDAHANVKTNLDAILSGSIDEAHNKFISEALDSDIIVEFECNECGYSFFEKFDYDYFEDEADLENVVETGDMDCPECGGCAVCVGYSYADNSSKAIHESKVQKHYKHKNLNESYRRTVARGNILIDNDLFVEFE